MEAVMKCAGIAVAGAVLALTVRNMSGQFAALVALAAVVAVSMLALEFLKPVLAFAETLLAQSDIVTLHLADNADAITAGQYKIGIGVILIMAAKSGKKQDIGAILCGFAVLMYGMEFMKNAVAPLAELPEFESMLTRFNNPLLGVLVGAVFTGIIQSSAASVGILQALSLTGSITYGMAIPIIMGQNIGTCVTALLSSIGTGRSARRVAAIHVSFNLIGTVICLIGFYGLNAIFQFPITA